MDFHIIEILTILAPTLGFLSWFYNRIDKRFDHILNETKEIKQDIRSVDSRLSKIEGKYEEREFQEWKHRRVK